MSITALNDKNTKAELNYFQQKIEIFQTAKDLGFKTLDEAIEYYKNKINAFKEKNA